MDQTNVLVTGGCGFLGHSIVSLLLSTSRFSITAVDITPPPPGTSTFTSSVRYVRANILDLEALQKVFQEAKPAIVIHTVGVYPLGAARYSMRNAGTVFKVNVDGTRNVIEAAKECGAKGLVYTSSVTVIFDQLEKDFINVDERWPTGYADTSYGQSKTMAENLVLGASSPTFATCSLRSAPIFGENDVVVIPTIHGLIETGQTGFILGDATNLQDYVYVENVAHAHVLAAQNLLNSQTAAGQAFFITNGEPTTLRDLCLAVWKQFGHVPKWEVKVPEGVAWGLGYMAEWVSWIARTEGYFCRGTVSDGSRTRYASIDKARRLLRYHPKVGLDEGVKRSCEAYRKRLEGREKK